MLFCLKYIYTCILYIYVYISSKNIGAWTMYAKHVTYVCVLVNVCEFVFVCAQTRLQTGGNLQEHFLASHAHSTAAFCLCNTIQFY